MVIDDMNASGGLLGRPLQMVLEDTATNEALAVTKVRKLVTQDKVDVVLGGITSSMRNAIKDTIVNRGKTLYIYPQLYEGKECTPYLFCTGPTPAQQCDTFIPWLIKNGGKKFYLPSADYVWPHVLNEYARKTIEKHGGEVVGEEYFPVDHNDYSATVNKIMSNKVNVVFNTTIPPGVAAFFKQLYEAGFSNERRAALRACTTTRTRSTSPRQRDRRARQLPRLFSALNDSAGNKIQQEYNKLYPGTIRFPPAARQPACIAAQAVGSGSERGEERQTRGRRKSARSREDCRRPGRRLRDGTRHAPREDEHVYRRREQRKVRDRRKEQGPGDARRVRVIFETCAALARLAVAAPFHRAPLAGYALHGTPSALLQPPQPLPTQPDSLP